jgi:LPXTG-motif cell wall-anchored protein
MSPTTVRSKFSQMRLSTLSEDHIYEVHYVHPGEKIGFKLRRVRKGTVIYRMPDGTPALVRVCGNPIRAARPTAVKGAFRRAPEASMPDSVADFQPYEPLESTVSPSPVPAPDMRAGEPYTGFVPSADLAEPVESPIAAEAITPNVLAPAAAVAHSASSFGAGPLLGALGALGGVAALTGGSGGGGGGGGIVSPPIGGGGGVGPTATPEPNAVLFGLALLSSGGAAVFLRRRKAKRS